MIQALAQVAINPQTLDYASMLTQEIDAFTLAHAGLLVPQGFTWLAGLFFLMCFKTFAMWGLFRRGDPFDVSPLVELFVKWAIAYSLLSFYDSPIPGAGVSAHQFFSEEARFIRATIDLSSLNTLMTAMGQTIGNLQKPGFGNLMGALVYVWTMADFAVIWLVSFLVPLTGYCALAIGSLLGPLFIPFLIIPTFEFLFFSWIKFMITYSLWSVVSAALVFIWANFMVGFFNRVVGRDYTLGHFMWVAPVMAAMVMGFAFVLFQTHRISSELSGGSASVGTPIGSIARAVGAAVAAA